MPIISIILPVYNSEKYLPKCLDALSNQTFHDIEIICIDDGSTDKSPEILQAYAKQDSRIRVLMQKNSGPAAARNLGLKNATGKYLMFCDSDDWYEPNMCAQMYQTITTQDVDVVVCGCNIFDEEKNVRSQEDLTYYQLKYSGKQPISDELIVQTNVLLWNKIFRTSLVKEYDITFPSGYDNDDDCFYWKYMSVAKTAYYLPDKLYNYLRRNNSIMGKVYHKTNKSLFDRLWVLENFYDFLCRYNLDLSKQKLFQKIYLTNWSLCNYYLTNKQQYKAYKIFRTFCKKIPPAQAKYLKQFCHPQYILRVGKLKLVELIYHNFESEQPHQKYLEIRLVLLSKLNLFQISLKDAIFRIKIFGLRILKIRQK